MSQYVYTSCVCVCVYVTVCMLQCVFQQFFPTFYLFIVIYDTAYLHTSTDCSIVFVSAYWLGLDALWPAAALLYMH
jgi:hypothetical protein